MEGMSPDEIRALLEDSERFWNSGDRERFLERWRRAVPGDYTLETPVGAEPRRGWDACRRDVWDEMRDATRLHTQRIIVCGNEAAAYVDNVITTPDGEVTVQSIDLYRFDADGSCYERNFF
jgi:hypothetical protein